MKIIKTQVLDGPNVWSNYRKKLIQVKIDLEAMEDFPTDRLPEFVERLKMLLPGLVEHECSEGVRGGFYQRLERGTWMGHVIEHVALELQSLAGMETGYGRTRNAGTKGVYNMVFCYEVEQAGLYAAEAAFRLVAALLKEQPYDLQADLAELNALRRRYALGPSTKSIVDEATKRGIPYKRLGRNSKIQLGYGKNQRRFQATITGNTTSDGVQTAGDKEKTKLRLAEAYVPVADGGVCSDEEGLFTLLDQIGFPVVLKPLDANQGKGASIDVRDRAAAVQAFAKAQEYGRYVLVEQFLSGHDYRLLVIDGKFVAASRRVPAHVVGDGISTVEELIEVANQDPRRGEGHEASLTLIKYDDDTATVLSKQHRTLASVPAVGETVSLKSTANLSTGGTAIDVTDEVHPENIFTAERIAKIIGLDICGIDLISGDIGKPLQANGGAVIEVNAAPGFRMHLDPSEGKPRNVAKAVVDMLYPEGSTSTIPLFSVTGTNGKTTTTRLLAHIAQSSGYTPGYTTTDGIYIGKYKIRQGDTTGPLSAAVVLQDPTVDFAVLETARGGLLRSGLYFDQCDVGIITNIEEDHLGLGDVHTLQDLANVKAVVARSVKKEGWAVLNGDDENCRTIGAELDCKVAYFTLDAENSFVQAHISNGGSAAVYANGAIVLHRGGHAITLDDVVALPITENGCARFMIANVLAASLAAYSWGFSVDQIRVSLRAFVPSYELTPGRMNLFELKNYKVLVDYAHNPHGLLALGDYLLNVTAVRKIGIIAGVGDRRDADIIQLASIAATMFDHVIVRQEHHLRGRTIDELNNLIVQGLSEGDPTVTYDLVPDEREAIQHALDIAGEGDFVVALSDSYHDVIQVITDRISAELYSTQAGEAAMGPIAI